MNYKSGAKGAQERIAGTVSVPSVPVDMRYCTQNTESVETSLEKIRNWSNYDVNSLCASLHNVRISLLLSNDTKAKCDYDQLPFPMRVFEEILQLESLSDEMKGVVLDIVYFITNMEYFDYEVLFSEDFYQMLLRNLMNPKLRYQSLNLIGNIVLDSEALCSYFIENGVFDEIEKDFLKTESTFMFQSLLYHIPINFLEVVNKKIDYLISYEKDECVNVRGLECLIILLNRNDIRENMINLNIFYEKLPLFIDGRNPKRLYKALKTCLCLTNVPDIFQKLIDNLNFYDIKNYLLTFDILIRFVNQFKDQLSNQKILEQLQFITKGSYDIVEKGITVVKLYYEYDNVLDHNLQILDFYCSFLGSDTDIQTSCLYSINELVNFCKIHFTSDEFLKILELLYQKKDMVIEILNSTGCSDSLFTLAQTYLNFLNEPL